MGVPSVLANVGRRGMGIYELIGYCFYLDLGCVLHL